MHIENMRLLKMQRSLRKGKNGASLSMSFNSEPKAKEQNIGLNEAALKEFFPMSPKILATRERVMGSTITTSQGGKTCSSFPLTTSQEIHSPE
jgi:hypothetical protein